MADQLRKLKRRQLLELLVAQGKELEAKQEELRAAWERIADLEDKLTKITDTGLESSGIVELAKREAEAYVDARKAEAEREAEEILSRARRGDSEAARSEAEHSTEPSGRTDQ